MARAELTERKVPCRTLDVENREQDDGGDEDDQEEAAEADKERGYKTITRRI